MIITAQINLVLRNFKLFKKNYGLHLDGIILLFDYIHLLKSLHKNWITEKSFEMKFIENGTEMVATCNVLQHLYGYNQAF